MPRVPLNGAMVNGEDHSVALPERDHLGPRLHAGSLLGQHELAAGEVSSRLRQQDRDLQRKDVLAVEILMQAVVVVRPVLEQKRCRSDLPGGVAASQKIGMRFRIAHVDAQRLIPAIGDRRQPGVEGRAQVGDDWRQRIREVLVFAAPVTMPGHDDATAKAAHGPDKARSRSGIRPETAGARALRCPARREPVRPLPSRAPRSGLQCSAQRWRPGRL